MADEPHTSLDPGETAEIVLDQARAEYDDDLRGKTRRSVFWTIGRAASDQIFSFTIFVLLARLLSKQDIGVFAMAYVFSEAGRIIATGGLTQLIARAPRIDSKLVDTIFWSNVGVAVIYVGMIWLTAPLIAELVHQPTLERPLQVLSFALLLNSMGASHMALRLRQFGHRTIAMRSVLSGLLGGGAAVLAALSGLGVWSLVIQRLITELIGMVLSWTAYPWKPGRDFDWSQVRYNLGFGGNLAIAQLIFLFLVRAQDLLIGAWLGAASVGIYRVAWRSAEIIGNGAIQPFAQVGLQTYSRLQSAPHALRNAYKAMLRNCSALSLPALIGFGVMSPSIVPLVFGAKWSFSGGLGQIFALMAVPYTLNYFASPVLTAMGDTRRQRTLAMIQLGSTLAFTWVALPYGLTAVAAAYVLRSYLTMPFQIRFLKVASSITFGDTIAAIRAPLIASTVMGAVVWTVLHLWRPAGHVGWPAVLTLVPLGAAVYAGVLLSISAEHVTALRLFVRRRTAHA